MSWQLVPVQVFIVQLFASEEGARNEVLFLASAAGAREGAALAAAPRMTTIDSTEVKYILIACFLEIFEEGAELEEIDEGGEFLMILRVGSTCLI